MKECDAGAARGKKGLSFLRNCLLKKKLADKRKVKTYMKSTQLNEEHIRWLENRVSSLENRSSELEKLDKLIEVQNEIKTVLKEDSGTARERKRKYMNSSLKLHGFKMNLFLSAFMMLKIMSCYLKRLMERYAMYILILRVFIYLV